AIGSPAVPPAAARAQPQLPPTELLVSVALSFPVLWFTSARAQPPTALSISPARRVARQCRTTARVRSRSRVRPPPPASASKPLHCKDPIQAAPIPSPAQLSTALLPQLRLPRS